MSEVNRKKTEEINYFLNGLVPSRRKIWQSNEFKESKALGITTRVMIRIRSEVWSVIRNLRVVKQRFCHSFYKSKKAMSTKAGKVPIYRNLK